VIFEKREGEIYGWEKKREGEEESDCELLSFILWWM
jgi:hypothetical protein